MADKNNKDPLEYNKFNSIIDSVLFITLITASLYFVGVFYYKSYFSKLSIPSNFINIEQSNYLIMGLMPVLVLGFFLAIFFKFWSQEPRNRMDALYCNQLFFIILLLEFFSYTLVFKNEDETVG